MYIIFRGAKMITLRIDRRNMVSSSEFVRNFSAMLDKSKEFPLFIMRNNDGY